MRGAYYLLIGIAFVAAGCNNTPKREMRQPTAEVFAIPPSNTYTTPPDLPRDTPLLTPKPQGGGGLGPNTPGLGGVGNPTSNIGAPGGRPR
ncbi:MAG: hypothetical protein EXS09_07510 [Gemmataceae bacterium]|nr:hypothetical protein [Gemmataceae bacterium]